MQRPYLAETRLLDFRSGPVAELVRAQGWLDPAPYDRIGRAYEFVRDGIAFGYNRADDIPASAVLADGYGQCNTNGTLFMALLRALGIPCRLHGFTIHKALQRGVVPGLAYRLAPESILRSWVAVRHEDRWINLEGFILDRPFLGALQDRFAGEGGGFCGYGVGTDCLADPPVDWVGRDTYIQRAGINADLGVFDGPDEFYASHRQDFGWLRGVIYRHLVRHQMNARAARIRRGGIPELPDGVVAHDHPAGAGDRLGLRAGRNPTSRLPDGRRHADDQAGVPARGGVRDAVSGSSGIRAGGGGGDGRSGRGDVEDQAR